MSMALCRLNGVYKGISYNMNYLEIYSKSGERFMEKSFKLKNREGIEEDLR